MQRKLVGMIAFGIFAQAIVAGRGEACASAGRESSVSRHGPS